MAATGYTPASRRRWASLSSILTEPPTLVFVSSPKCSTSKTSLPPSKWHQQEEAARETQHAGPRHGSRPRRSSCPRGRSATPAPGSGSHHARHPAHHRGQNRRRRPSEPVQQPCPPRSPSLHIPWALTDDYASLGRYSADLGFELGTVNSNTFHAHKFGSLTQTDRAVRRMPTPTTSSASTSRMPPGPWT